MDINQDDIDKLLQNALEGGDGDAAPAAPVAAAESNASGGDAEPDYSGVASQDDIDALFAAIGDSPEEAPGPPTGDAAPVAEAEPEAEPESTATPELDLSGVADQDDIDALFAAVGSDAAPEAPPTPAEPAAEADGGVADQSDIDALFEAAGGAAEAEPVAEVDDGVADQSDIDALFDAASGSAAAAESASGATAGSAEQELPAAPDEGPASQDDIDALFGAGGGAGAEPVVEEASIPEEISAPEAEGPLESMEEGVAPDASPEDPEAELDALLSSISDGAEASAGDAAGDADEFDMDELLREVSEAAPPPPPPPVTQAAPDGEGLDAFGVGAGQPDASVIDDGDVLVRDEFADPEPAVADSFTPDSVLPGLAESLPTQVAASVQSVPAAVAAPSSGVMAGHPSAVSASAPARREFSVLYGAGDIESVSNQISSLLSAMSEKAHGYMQSWIAADSEAKELRARALDEERRRTSLESEKRSLVRQVDELRTRASELEGVKIASEESSRTLETSYQTKIRELENRLTLATSEAETLKEELTRSRNQATGVDIESRRVRFELDRLKSEVESERMERLRIQRALENREKEIQAMQAQAGGQASSLFIDELHRLVRRLETELDARSSGAHDALRQLDHLEVSEEMVPVAANLRAALQHALGQDSDPNDALKALGREASGVRGGAAVSPQKAEMLSFETALSTYNLTGSVDIAGVLLREAVATPSALMRRIYQNPSLRRPEIGDHLVGLTRLLEGLRTVQESNDRSRGTESGESEVFYVHMFDYLHNLVRLKLITRLSGDIWRLFLDLRGRFSFVTSDKQWAEYRDNTLRDRK